MTLPNDPTSRSALQQAGVRLVGAWCLALVLVIALVVATGSDASLSARLCQDAGVGRVRHDWQVMSSLANPTPTTSLAVGSALLALLSRRLWHAVILIAIPFAASSTANMLKDLLRRPRPLGECASAQVAQGYSLPSGHAVGATAGLVLIALVVLSGRRRVGIPMLAVLSLATIISASRVVLGVHFVSDVVVGQLWGSLWAVLGVLLLERGRRRPDGRTRQRAGSQLRG